MINKFFTFSLSTFIAIFFTGISIAQVFFDDFESYTVGGQLVCQDSINWTTWNQNPCDPMQDPFISNNYAHSGTNSVVIVENNDLIKPMGTQTAGLWDISFMLYIPSGKAGYFNCMSEFFGSPKFWALQVAFEDDGTGFCADGTGPPPTFFNYSQDEWILVRVVVDLDSDSAEFSLAGVSIFTWQWTNGNGPLQLDVVDFYGDIPTFEMYIDDFMYDNIVSVENEEELPTDFSLSQNYPNPFNPTTKINYQIAEYGFTSLKVYDALGSEVITLVNGEHKIGSYEIEFDASNLPSGIYFYQLQADNFIQTKKMILLK